MYALYITHLKYTYYIIIIAECVSFFKQWVISTTQCYNDFVFFQLNNLLIVAFKILTVFFQNNWRRGVTVKEKWRGGKNHKTDGRNKIS